MRINQTSNLKALICSDAMKVKIPHQPCSTCLRYLHAVPKLKGARVKLVLADLGKGPGHSSGRQAHNDGIPLCISATAACMHV